MSGGLDLKQFYETFFDEAAELLADMEEALLGLDVNQPDKEQLNAIFRVAHSIKGGASTFGSFDQLANTTHLLENLLDALRNNELPLEKHMVDLFLETKDVLADQLAAYRLDQEPDEAAYSRICEQLRQLASLPATQAPLAQASTPAQLSAQAISSSPPAQASSAILCVKLTGLSATEVDLLHAEMALLGTVKQTKKTNSQLTVWLDTTASADDLKAVACFIVNPDQVQVDASPAPGSTTAPSASSAQASASAPAKPEKPTASSTLRVGVEKVDQIINLVGELVITQAMLAQTASTLDPVEHDRLLNGIEQLERNARDLQESVMSIRMMPMDYVFRRFPRVVRESAARLGKEIHLLTRGAATELDKSLIEKILDPLTHLVRNSLDHGIEEPEARVAQGKAPGGTLTLSAQHSGGHIVIEVSDDGAGLDRQKILDKAVRQGFPVNELTPDDELWQLIFAPGFSTAQQVTDISGRGVGMDVVRRNIQSLGGHIQLSSQAGLGTTVRIVLPLTLAILDGMSVQTGNEVFILPLAHVSESMQPAPDQIHAISDTEKLLLVRGEYLPLVALHELFNIDKAQTNPAQAIAVILDAEESRFALLVDQLVGQQQVVVKNLEANYRKVPGISAATILGDGSVALIIDVFALLRLTRAPQAVPGTGMDPQAFIAASSSLAGSIHEAVATAS